MKPFKTLSTNGRKTGKLSRRRQGKPRTKNGGLEKLKKLTSAGLKRQKCRGGAEWNRRET